MKNISTKFFVWNHCVTLTPMKMMMHELTAHYTLVCCFCEYLITLCIFWVSMLWSAISECWEFLYHLRPMECPLSARAHLYKRFECDVYECVGEQLRVSIWISRDNTLRTLQRPLTKVPNGQNAHSKWRVDELVTLFHVLSALWGALLFPSIPAIDRWMTQNEHHRPKCPEIWQAFIF